MQRTSRRSFEEDLFDLLSFYLTVGFDLVYFNLVLLRYNAAC